MESMAIVLDSTVRSQDSSNSKASKRSKDSCASDAKPESCLESKHSKEILITEKQQRQEAHAQQDLDDREKLRNTEAKDDTSLLMFTSCGQLFLGILLVVFGILVLVHGATLGGSGAGLWAGMGALVAGALGVAAALATSSSKTNSSFLTAHLAASLIALALSNMAAITALTAIVRDSQRTPEVTLLAVPDEGGSTVEIKGGWAGLLSSIGLLVISLIELFVSGHTCLTLSPKLCGCLRTGGVEDAANDGRLKTRNMVHQWVTAQSPVPKSQPIYLVQPMLPVHPMIQTPYAIPGVPAKYTRGFVAGGAVPLHAPAYGAVPIRPLMPYAARPPSQIIRPKQKRHLPMEHEETLERKKHAEGKAESPRRMSSIGEDQVDLTETYTGLDKKISEEFISIAMDPERKSKGSSSHGSEIGTAKTS